MPMNRTNSSSASTKSASRRAALLKQGTLGFSSTKRAASTGSIGKAKGSGKPARPTTKRASGPEEVIEVTDGSSDNVSEKESEGEGEVGSDGTGELEVSRAEREERGVKRRRIGMGVFGSRNGAENVLVPDEDLGESANRSPVAAEGETKKGRTTTARKGAQENDTRVALDPRDKRWRRHFGEVRAKMGNLEPSEFSFGSMYCVGCCWRPLYVLWDREVATLACGCLF